MIKIAIAFEPNTKLPPNVHYAHFMECINYDIYANTQDIFNPFLSSQDIIDRTCPHCNHYFPSKAMLKRHISLKICKTNRNIEKDTMILDLFDNITPSLPLSQIKEIKTHKTYKNKQIYLVKYSDESQEYVHLPPDFALVQDYDRFIMQTPTENDNDHLPLIELSELSDFLGFNHNQTFINDTSTNLFDDDVDQRAQKQMKEIQRQRLKDYVHNQQIERLPDVDYKKGKKYHEEEEEKAYPDDMPISEIREDRKKKQFKKKQREYKRNEKKKKLHRLMPSLKTATAKDKKGNKGKGDKANKNNNKSSKK